MEIYERMKQYINDHHLKQSSIAEEIGLSRSIFSMMLNGERRVLATDLEKFCKAVEEPPEKFLNVNFDTKEKEA